MLLAITISWAAAAAGLAIYIALREARHPARTAMVAALALECVRAILSGIGLGVMIAAEMLVLERWRFAVGALTPWVWLLVALTFARANSPEILQRWRAAIAVGGLVTVILLAAFWSSLMPISGVASWTGLWVSTLGRTGQFLCIMQLVLYVGALAQLERTLRAATGAMRWRIKFAVLGMGTILLGGLYGASESLLYASVDQSRAMFHALAGVIGGGLLLLSLKRGRLRDVELYLSHKAIYRSVTLIFAGAYLLIVGGLARLAGRLEQQVAFPMVPLAVLLAMLFLAWWMLSDRIRHNLKRTISRHFRRPVHDDRAIWDALTAQTASVVDPQAYCRVVTRFLADTFELHAASIWLIDERRGRVTPGASTAVTVEQAAALLPAPGRHPAVIAALREHRGVFNLGATSQAALADIRSWCPWIFFEDAGQLCMPLHAGGEFVGVLALGDRINKDPFDAADLDLINTIGAQVGAGLLTLVLAARVADAHEMQAFETMSAFLIHDLKNTASTLGLMLQNMPVHFEDPAFRADALQAMTRSVKRINDVIRRIAGLRFKPTLHKAPTDLNDLLRGVVAELAPMAGPRLRTTWGELPVVEVDSEELQKVATNLLMNGLEAGGPDGALELVTARRGTRVSFSVRDHGGGITPEFLERGLFRPFKTTKKNGMGIGLYQSRLIVEAHGGAIGVETELGRGSTFTVTLPIS